MHKNHMFFSCGCIQLFKYSLKTSARQHILCWTFKFKLTFGAPGVLQFEMFGSCTHGTGKLRCQLLSHVVRSKNIKTIFPILSLFPWNWAQETALWNQPLTSDQPMDRAACTSWSLKSLSWLLHGTPQGGSVHGDGAGDHGEGRGQGHGDSCG